MAIIAALSVQYFKDGITIFELLLNFLITLSLSLELHATPPQIKIDEVL